MSGADLGGGSLSYLNGADAHGATRVTSERTLFHVWITSPHNGSAGIWPSYAWF